MFDKLAAVFEELEYPYYRLDAYNDVDNIDNEFFTYWNQDSESQAFYENAGHKIVHRYTVQFLTTNPRSLYTALQQFIAAARAAGFIVSGLGVDARCSSPNHFAREVNVTYVQYL